MGRTCGEPDEIELTPMGVELNGSWRVLLAVDQVGNEGGEGLGRDGEGGGCGQRGKVEEVRHQGGAVRGGLEEDAVLVEGAVRHEPVAILGLDHDARPHAAEGRHHEGAVAGQDAALDVQLERPDQVFPRVVPKYKYF